MKKVISILIPILACFLVGLTASQFQAESIKTWYPFLNKPALTPPNIVFPIAWSIIYLCMGVSFGMILLAKSKAKAYLTKVFILQLSLNFIWSILFFYYQSPLLGFLDIILLDGTVAWYTLKSYQVRKASSFLFLPYLFWICFATYLNGYILFNN